ncbi:hypothetical protein [Paenibacillus hamazuiensis]|uniref:hypothetical protein n=1 Tax=Paenibacillus hamazuiensis TaxID=2936508 RepID=UPI0020100865|nr:hypothetical protein [Paenibacillus hamazuiensis]
MRLKQLIEALHALIAGKNVVGIDVCGELSAQVDAWRNAGQIRLNEQANLAIFESALMHA